MLLKKRPLNPIINPTHLTLLPLLRRLQEIPKMRMMVRTPTRLVLIALTMTAVLVLVLGGIRGELVGVVVLIFGKVLGVLFGCEIGMVGGVRKGVLRGFMDVVVREVVFFVLCWGVVDGLRG